MSTVPAAWTGFDADGNISLSKIYKDMKCIEYVSVALL